MIMFVAWYRIRKYDGEKYKNSILWLTVYGRTNGHSRKSHIQSLQNESTILGVFWEFLWHKNFVCKNCETTLALEFAHMPSWPTAFEKSEIHQSNLEKLQFEGSKIEGFLLDF